MFRRNKNQPVIASQPEEEVARQSLDDAHEAAIKEEERRIKENLREVAKAPQEHYERLSEKARELFAENDRAKEAHAKYQALQEESIAARRNQDTRAEKDLSLQMRDAQVSADSLLAELLEGEISEIKEGWKTGQIPRIVPGIVGRGSGGQYFTFEDVDAPKFKADMSSGSIPPTFRPGMYVPVPAEWEPMNLPDTEVPLHKTFYAGVRGDGLPANVDVFKDPQLSECSLDELQGWQAVAERAVQPIE